MEVRVVWVDLIRSAGHMPIAGDVDLDVTCRGGYDPPSASKPLNQRCDGPGMEEDYCPQKLLVAYVGIA